MYLERLELIGFKSFAKRTILKFAKPNQKKFNITAIVGPNGSGKSNLGESIRWALGEQSLKALRGKKSEDIIFSGSSQKKHLNSAEVILFFNNEDESAAIDYKEFTITRKIYRNGENEYLINKNRVRLQDILLLMAKTNFGQKSYSIISQGTIQQILELSSGERQRFFNEATSIKQYQIKQDNAQRKIEKSQGNLQQTAIVLSEIKPLLNSLGRQIQKLEKRQEIEKELHEKQIKYYHHSWQALRQKNITLNKEIKAKEQERKQIVQALEDVQEKSKNFFKKTIGQEYQRPQQEYQQLLEEKNQYISEQSLLNDKLIEEQRKTDQKIKINREIGPKTEELIQGLQEIKIIQEKLWQKIRQAENEKDWEEIKIWAEKAQEKTKKLLDSFLIKNSSQLEKSPFNKESLDKIQKEKEILNQKIKIIDERLQKASQKMEKFSEETNSKEKEMLFWQKDIHHQQIKLGKIDYQISELKIELARWETREQALDEEIENEIKNYSAQIKKLVESKEEKIYQSSASDLEKINKLKYQLEIIGGIDPEVMKEYPKVRDRHEFLEKQSIDLEQSIKSLNKISNELDQKIKSQFQESFNKINHAFNRYFKIIFNGGDAKIELTEIIQENGKEEKNIDILATPPGKKIKNISMLSGGEKALTSLALIAAIISINKPPFVILDEVAASLDQENSSRFAKIIRELSNYTQFIVVTHNQEIIEISDILYGITMQEDGTSKLLSLQL